MRPQTSERGRDRRRLQADGVAFPGLEVQAMGRDQSLELTVGGEGDGVASISKAESECEAGLDVPPRTHGQDHDAHAAPAVQGERVAS